jgi:PAS domain S-box-containing protein
MLTNFIFIFIFIFLIGLSAYLWREKYLLTRQLRDCGKADMPSEYGQRYQEVFEHTSDAILVVEVKGSGRLILGSYNSAAVQMLGLEIGSVKGLTIDGKFNQSEDTESRRILRELYARISDAIESGMPVRYENEIHFASKEHPDIYEFNVVPMADDAGISHIFCFARNVTVAKMYEQEMLERARLEQQLSSFAASAPGFFFSFQHGRDGSNSMPFASNGIYDLFGLRPEDVALNISRLTLQIHHDDLKSFFDAIADSAANHTPVDIEFRAQHPGRGELWIESRSLPIDMPDNSILWHGFMHDVTERKLLGLRLNDTKEKLRELMLKNEAKRENERKRIAWEMHEELGQLLATIKMRFSGMRTQLLRDASLINEDSRIIIGLIDKSIKSIRELVSDLRPPVLQHGLEVALEWLVTGFKEQSGLKCTLEINEDHTLVTDVLTTLVFRVAQEVLENIVRHSGVTHVAISWFNYPGQTMLTISHNGTATDDYSLTLFGIQERVLAVGGEMQIFTDAEFSSAIQVRFPACPVADIQQPLF